MLICATCPAKPLGRPRLSSTSIPRTLPLSPMLGWPDSFFLLILVSLSQQFCLPQSFGFSFFSFFSTSQFLSLCLSYPTVRYPFPFSFSVFRFPSGLVLCHTLVRHFLFFCSCHFPSIQVSALPFMPPASSSRKSNSPFAGGQILSLFILVCIISHSRGLLVSRQPFVSTGRLS